MNWKRILAAIGSAPIWLPLVVLAGCLAAIFFVILLPFSFLIYALDGKWQWFWEFCD